MNHILTFLDRWSKRIYSRRRSSENTKFENAIKEGSYVTGRFDKQCRHFRQSDGQEVRPKIQENSSSSRLSTVASSAWTRSPRYSPKGSFIYVTKLTRKRMQSRHSYTAPWKIHKSDQPSCRDCLKRHFAGGSSHRHADIRNDLGHTKSHHKNGNFKRTANSKKTQRLIPQGFFVGVVTNRKIIGTTFCRCGAKQKNLTEDEERKAHAALEDGLVKVSGLAQLEIILQRLRRNFIWPHC